MSFFDNRDHGTPNNHNLAMYLPLTIAVLSALLMATKNQAFIFKIAFFPGNPDLFAEPWRFLTYAFFVYSRPLTLLFTTLFLWWVGMPVEQQFGSRTYALFFLICSISAALIAIVTSAISPWGRIPLLLGPEAMLWGATWLFSRLHPDQVFHFMLILPVKAKYFPLLLIGARLLFSGIEMGTSSIPKTALLLATEIAGAAIGILFLHLLRRNAMTRTQKNAGKAQKKSEAIRIKERETGLQAARPLLDIGARMGAGRVSAQDHKRLGEALDQSFDFTICPLSDFDRDDSYCQGCPAYTHCLAKEIRTAFPPKKTGKP